MFGVRGGIGPEATADFLSKLMQTDAELDQRHLSVLAWFISQIPDGTSSGATDGIDTFALNGVEFLGSWDGQPAASLTPSSIPL